MARGQEILGHSVFLPRQQFASGDSDQLDGNAARFVIGVSVDAGLAIGEANHRREGPRLGEHAVPGMRGQIGQHPEFGQESCVDLGVKPAERPVLVGVLLLIGDNIVRKSSNSAGSPARGISFQAVLGDSPFAARAMNCLRRHKKA